MAELSLMSQAIFYLILILMSLYMVPLCYWQVSVLRGKAMNNTDGTVDDWHQQKTHYGIAFADIFVACPVNILGIALLILAPRWGYYLLALLSFWWVWANVMTTATSLRFEKPNITLSWIVAFPAGAIIGLTYILWTMIHFETIYKL